MKSSQQHSSLNCYCLSAEHRSRNPDSSASFSSIILVGRESHCPLAVTKVVSSLPYAS